MSATLTKLRFPCTPEHPGTGPEGKTCSSCANCRRPGLLARQYIDPNQTEAVCALMAGAEEYPVQQIDTRWPACERFVKAD